MGLIVSVGGEGGLVTGCDDSDGVSRFGGLGEVVTFCE